jgi:cell division control protein 6
MSQGVFKDISKLSFDYVPEKLPHRERQLHRLEMLFSPVIDNNYSQNAVLVGSVGTGKTVTSKRFCTELALRAGRQGKLIEWTIVNCRQRNSETATLLKLINYFDQNFPDRGFSAQELRRVLRKHIEKRQGHIIFIIDEADALLRANAGDLIYFLSRLSEESDSLRNKLSIILISQRHVLDMLDPAALSTFKRSNIIEFTKYTTEELYDILMARAEMALVAGSYSDEVIEAIAEAASEWGDARFAIELLEKSGMLANERGASSISVEDVRGAKAATYAYVTEEKILGLSKEQMLIMLSAARVLRNKAFAETAEIEKGYRVACEEFDEKPRARTQFYAHIKELAGLGLLEIRQKKGSVAGMANIITMPDVPADVMVSQLEKILEKGGNEV